MPKGNAMRKKQNNDRVSVMHYLVTHEIMGGLETNVLTLCEHLDFAKVNPMINCAEDSHDELFRWAASMNVAVHTSPVEGRSRLRYLRRTLSLARLLRRERTDVLHIHAIGVRGVTAFLAALLARVPAVVVSHHSWYGAELASWGERVSMWFERRFAWVITLFHEEEREMKSVGIPPERIVAVPHGVDLRKFPYRDGPPEGSESEFRLVMVARMMEGKGHEELLRATHLLKGKYPQLRVLMVGDGPTRARIEALISELDLQQVVTLAGYVPNDEVPALLHTGHVIVNPTYAIGEVFGIVLIEGAAVGLPAVATRYGGIPERIVDGETGLLVEPQDVEGLAGAIEKLVSNPQLAAEMGRKARLHVEESYSAEVVGKMMTSLYLRASAAGRRSTKRRLQRVRNADSGLSA
jgi:glycosyltransferase involved in cell wall biosynthesis